MGPAADTCESKFAVFEEVKSFNYDGLTRQSRPFGALTSGPVRMTIQVQCQNSVEFVTARSESHPPTRLKGCFYRTN